MGLAGFTSSLSSPEFDSAPKISSAVLFCTCFSSIKCCLHKIYPKAQVILGWLELSVPVSASETWTHLIVYFDVLSGPDNQKLQNMALNLFEPWVWAHRMVFCLYWSGLAGFHVGHVTRHTYTRTNGSEFLNIKQKALAHSSSNHFSVLWSVRRLHVAYPPHWWLVIQGPWYEDTRHAAALNIRRKRKRCNLDATFMTNWLVVSNMIFISKKIYGIYI